MTPEFTAATVAGAIAWVLLLFAAVLAIMKARRARREMWQTTRELARRTDQLLLLNRFTFLLTQETRRQGVARAATEFLVQEMGAGRAVFWRPDSEGEPEAPWLSFPAGDDSREAAPTLPEAQRIIMARTAGRSATPLVLAADSQDQRPHPLHRAADAPAQGFALYVPLHGSPREGVLEVYAGREPWGLERWELLAPLTAELDNALRRARHYEEVQERADVDFVTGLFNHRFMQSYLHKLIGADTARGRTFSVLLMDVNDFKSFNDTYGHSVGDRVLQVVARQLRLMTDREGVVGRFGGDEFIVVLPAHGRPEASAFAQAFEDWLTNYAFKVPGGKTVPIVVSAGLAVFPDDGERRQELLASADARLYQCKRSRVNGMKRRHAGSQPTLGVFGFLDGLVTAIDSRDHYTRAHCESTAEYAVMLAQEIGLSPSAQRTLRLASLLHDVGKICIPDHILHKPGALTADEFEVIKHHVSIAEDLIVDVPDAEEVRTIARHHHERFDGSGYPDGIRGEEIPFLARILALADAFSAITLDRPYRRGLARDEAYAELQRVAGTQLDPELVKSFGRVVAALEDEPAAVAASF